MTPDAIDPAILARLRTPPGKPTDVRLYVTLRLIERASAAVLTEDGVLVLVGESGHEYPQDLEVVDELERLGWIVTHDVDAVTVTEQGKWWSKRFGDMNRVRR
jgi:predicted methyltransferase